MWLRLAAHGYEFHYLDEPLVRYRLSPLGASRKPATQALTRESMARSLLEHVGVSPETDASKIRTSSCAGRSRASPSPSSPVRSASSRRWDPGRSRRRTG